MQRDVGPKQVECLANVLEKPLLDNRKYRVIRLPNEMEVLLVHDAETDSAAAAMSVGVGSASDPDDMPGMAHAVEHALFMGTKKFPVENSYDQYLQQNGGYSNAGTSMCSTNFFFEVNATSAEQGSPFYGALDRFAQFFIEPLFLEDTLDRELRAVDSENKKNLQVDRWRMNQLDRSLSSKQHPLHKFGTGNYHVLHDEPISRGVVIRDEFINFYQTHYSANRMKLAVLGRESLDELQKWTEELFSNVKNKNLPKLRWDNMLIYDKDEVPTVVNVKPIMDKQDLRFQFEFIDQENLYESQPGHYISHLVGHEGPGSLLAYLKEKGWASELACHASDLCPGTGMFFTYISLTDMGMKEWRQVVKAFFQYIGMLNEKPPQEWIAEELKKLSEIQFKFKQKIQASATVGMLAEVMQKPYPREWLLSGGSVLRRFDPELITRGMECIVPSKLRLYVRHKDLPTNSREKWYGTEYRCEKISDEFMSQLEDAMKGSRPADLHLPAPNEFIPQRLDVEKREVATPAEAPTLIRNETNIRVWHKKDDQFWVPKAIINICLRSPLTDTTPFTSILTDLYCELVTDSLSTYSYDADVAGLEYTLYHTSSKGLQIEIGGYNDKIPVLLTKVIHSMRNLTIREDRFTVILERLLRSTKNFFFQEPYHQLNTYTRSLLIERTWTNEDYLSELPHVTPSTLRLFTPQLLEQLHIEILAHGNLTAREALLLSRTVEDGLQPHPYPPAQWPPLRSIDVVGNHVYTRLLADRENINNCISYTLFFGCNIPPRKRALVLLTAQMLKEPAFDTLRTKEQLGYVVLSGAVFGKTIAGIRFVVQSERSCAFLCQRVEAFLGSFGGFLGELGEETFAGMREGYRVKLLERLRNLREENQRLWGHIASEKFEFGLVRHDVEGVGELGLQDVRDFWREEVLGEGGPGGGGGMLRGV
ncbi:a-pheromone processing metallopeptidase-like protein Ste23 [Piedraia hortae CBS 480.64]|uniref:A-pheromone processing metallopeptidase-like protein Ste23 n=1 Tax=Piedraia hortae CBS 480.64 TaxID=1314780 RepID=A0A6A7BV34_9PEZI|nr:a-pheromone processing metallopeptidase-like protein Ste23 [Piedraia hortae CBS 480.64]